MIKCVIIHRQEGWGRWGGWGRTGSKTPSGAQNSNVKEDTETMAVGRDESQGDGRGLERAGAAPEDGAADGAGPGPVLRVELGGAFRA